LIIIFREVNGMKLKSVVLGVVAIFVLVSAAMAVPAEKTLEFTGSPMGKVIFDGKTHNAAAESCSDCHKTGVFPKMKKGAVTIIMKDIYEGKYCGACHDGKVTFKAMGNCNRCHKK
jgi:c(7)-type cytochrome triheme protein